MKQNASTSYKGLLSGSIWGLLSKIFDAFAKFFTIPMLVALYGKADYGLIALAFSLNAYLRLMDMGMNIGSIRFFSTWISKGEYEKIGAVSRSSIVFYGAIGIINTLIFIFIANYPEAFFRIESNQLFAFKWIMYILAVSCIFNWLSNVLTQLITANGDVAWINQVSLISSLFNLITAFIAVKLNISIEKYFVLFTLSTMVVIPFNLYKLKVFNMSYWSLLAPKWDGKAFGEILKYSMAIFAMGIFQFSADSLRPLLLSKYSSQGMSILTDFRVIQTISALVVAFGGVFIQVLLPAVSKLYAEGSRSELEKLIYDATKYISIFICFIVFILVVNSENILLLYMGKNYGNLSLWLIIWLLSLLGMHSSPVASLVLSTGKTRPLVIMSAISCIATLIITAVFAERYKVGSAVLGYVVYVFLQNAFYYFYYIPKVLFLDKSKLFLNKFMPPLLIGLSGWLAVEFVKNIFSINNKILQLLINSGIFTLVFAGSILIFALQPKDLMAIKKKLKMN